MDRCKALKTSCGTGFRELICPTGIPLTPNPNFRVRIAQCIFELDGADTHRRLKPEEHYRRAENKTINTEATFDEAN